MTRRLVWIVLLLVAIGAAGWLIYRAVRPPSLGETATVYRGSINATLDALGTVQARRQINVSSRVGGVVQSVAVRPGDYVYSGTLLLELDNPDVLDALAQAESALALRTQELEEALSAPDQATIDLAVARLRRATVLRQRAQQDYDALADQPDAGSSDEALALEAAKLEYQIAEAEYDRTLRGTPDLDLARLRASVTEARRAMQRGQERVAQLRLVAPMDGTVMQVNTQVGENTYAYNALVQIADLTRLEVRADISELDIGNLINSRGEGYPPFERQGAWLWLEAFPGDILRGEVVRVSPAPSSARGMTTYAATIAFDPSELQLRPGMGVNVTITTQTVEDALLAPRRAVRTVGGNEVVRVVVGGRASEVQVTTGLSNTDEVQVLTGLAEGQQVLVD